MWLLKIEVFEVTMIAPYLHMATENQQSNQKANNATDQLFSRVFIKGGNAIL